MSGPESSHTPTLEGVWPAHAPDTGQTGLNSLVPAKAWARAALTNRRQTPAVTAQPRPEAGLSRPDLAHERTHKLCERSRSLPHPPLGR